MAASTSLLDEAREAWRYARQGTIREVDNLPDDRFDFRSTPENRSVAELVQHIIESGRMMAGELSRPDGDFRRQSFDKFVQEYAGDVRQASTKPELRELLRSTHEEGDVKIAEAGELQMLQLIRQFNGEPATRLSWMYHGIAHEMYHRGQLTLYARLLGKTPALTKQMRGEE